MRIILFFLMTQYCIGALAQVNESVFLKWKLSPNEILTYISSMKEMDSSQYKGLSIDFEAFNHAFKNSEMEYAKEFLGNMDNIQEHELIVNLTETKKGIIDIEIMLHESRNPKGQDSTNMMEDLLQEMQKMQGGVMVRGAVYDNGSIKSFYLNKDQRNLISILFELPNKEIKVGDSWELDVNLISVDANFKCDSSYKQNNVTLIEIKNSGTEKIAVLKYDITEFIEGQMNSPFLKNGKKTTMKMTHNAIAEFSIDKGRWLKYEGILSLNSSGFMTSNTKQRMILRTN